VLGGLPYIRRVGPQVEVRNIHHVHLIASDSITGLKLHRYRMGHGTCPAIKTTGRTIAVSAYFGADLDELAADLGIVTSGSGRRRRLARLRKPASDR
jgi:hypothetical protein